MSLTKLKGIAASSGIAIAKAFHLSSPDLSFEKVTIDHAESEIKRLMKALNITKLELEEIKLHTEKKLDREHAKIFASHILVLSDPEVIHPIIDKIETEKVNAEYALDETANMFINEFQNMDNEYMRERIADIKDVTQRVMSHLI